MKTIYDLLCLYQETKVLGNCKSPTVQNLMESQRWNTLPHDFELSPLFDLLWNADGNLTSQWDRGLS